MNLDRRQLSHSKAKPKSLLLATLLGVVIATMPGVARADSSGSSAPINYAATSFATTTAADATDATKIFDFFPELWNANQKTPVLRMDSISPAQGPTTGKHPQSSHPHF